MQLFRAAKHGFVPFLKAQADTFKVSTRLPQINSLRFKIVPISRASNTSLPAASSRLSDRIFSAAYYVGLAPLARCKIAPSPTLFLQHHWAQAMALLFLFLLWFCVSLVLDFTQFLILIYSPALDRCMDNVELFSVGGLMVLLGFLLLVWITALVLAMTGSSRQIPFLNRLTHRRRIIAFASKANHFLLVLLPILALLTCHATSLTRRSSQDAALYFLYDDGIPLPRCGYALGLYRISLQAQEQWGKGSVVLDRLNEENLRTALLHGKVVVLATHGAEGCVYAFNYPIPFLRPGTFFVSAPNKGATYQTNDTRFLHTSTLGADKKWSKIEKLPVNRDLQLAYIFACHGGERMSEWEEHLAPARVIAYNRNSSVWDHAWWFAFTGPPQIKSLK